MENIDRLFREDQLLVPASDSAAAISPPHKKEPSVLLLSPELTPSHDSPPIGVAPFPYPLSFPAFRSPSVESESEPKPRSKRGRKPMFAGMPEPQRKILAQAARAAKNRRCARESRAKKQRYINQLEEEVERLKTELAECKRKFARYELIDRQLDLADAEDQHVFAAAMEEMQLTKATSRQFPDIFIRKMNEKLEERRKAMEQLARLTVEIAVPLTLRSALRCAWDYTNVNEPEKIFGCAPNSEDAENLRSAFEYKFPGPAPDLGPLRETTAKILRRLRDSVKQMLRSQRSIQFETWRIWVRLTEDFMPKHLPGKVEDSVVFHQKLRGMPELGDFAVFQLEEGDFDFDTGEAVRERLSRFGSTIGLERDVVEHNNAREEVKS